MKFRCRDMRLAFPNLFEPYKDSFGARLIYPPDHVQVVDATTLTELGMKAPSNPKAKLKTKPILEAIAKAVAKAKWPDKWQSIYAALQKQDKLFFHDGATKAEYEGFEGNEFVAANSKTRPTILDQLRNELTKADGKPYSGCYVNAIIEVWAQDHKEHGKRINANLKGIQFLRDGDAFSGAGKPADADEFDEEDVSDTGDAEEAEPDLEG